jgi:hypothetical protein
MPKKLDCNKYYVVDNEEDADQIIVPFDINGNPQPRVYLASKNRANDMVVPGEVGWISSVPISRKGTQEEYNALVDWWFDNASAEYKQSIQKAYGAVCNVTEKIEQLKLWLKRATKTERKSRLDLFILRCLGSEYNKGGKKWHG